MSASLNRVDLIGNVGRDPEIRVTAAGSKVANLSIATSDRWKDKSSGEWQERTEWHRVVVWGDGLVGIIERYVTKGSRLMVTGKLQTRKWTDQSGAEKYSTEISVQGPSAQVLLLGDKSGGARSTPDEPTAEGGLDDEIPF